MTVSADAFADDVRAHLMRTPRQLPTAYLYDALGSALFESICELPWYPVARAEARLIARHARDVFRRFGELSTIVELGSGSGEKLRLLLESGYNGSRTSSRRPLALHLVDVSATALRQAERALSELDHVRVIAHERSYETGLDEYAMDRHPADQALMVFLGSNIGNFDRDGAGALLGHMRASLQPGDALLIGADLVKPASTLRLAYDDPLGVTAAFNRNLLVRINRELGGNFDVCQFAHRAVWAPEASRVEMHLVSRVSQRVRIGAQGPRADNAGGAADLVDITFAENESIWTESSYKYSPEELVLNLQQTGFRLLKQWIDRDDGFALTLAEAV